MIQVETDRLAFTTRQKAAFWVIYVSPLLLLWVAIAVLSWWWWLLFAVMGMACGFHRYAQRHIVVRGDTATYRRAWGSRSFDLDAVTGVRVGATGVTIFLKNDEVQVPDLFGMKFGAARQQTAEGFVEVLRTVQRD